MEPDNAAAPKVSPLDAERERLRKEGYTEAEISQILIARATSPSQATAGAGQAVAPGVFSGTLGNVGAAMSYGRSFLPTLRGDLVKTFDRALSPIQRIEAALFLAFKVAVIAVIAYAVKQEWDQHIISATKIAEQQALKTAAEARTADAESKAATATFKNPDSDESLARDGSLKGSLARTARIRALNEANAAHGLTQAEAAELANLISDQSKARGWK